MTGMRKLLFGCWAFALTWAYLMWAPEITSGDRQAALVLQGTIVTAVIGANAYEHRQARKRANSGAGQAGVPAGPGASPAADMEGLPAVDGASGETEREQ